MSKFGIKRPNLVSQTSFRYIAILGFCLFLLAITFNIVQTKSSAQTTVAMPVLPPTSFRIGEKLTYTISFDRYKNAGYVETNVVSRGKLSNRDVVELSSKIKTNEFVSAAYSLFDETRTTFAAPDSGLPLYIRRISNATVFPDEKINNYLEAPTQNFDLLTLIYRIRVGGGNGSFALQEDEKFYTVNAQAGTSENVKTDGGAFDTVISTVQSEYFTERNITDLRINFSADENHIPVLVRFKIGKGEFRVSLASAEVISNETAPTPTPVTTPIVVVTATPKPSPTPYIENQPLSAELPFVLGETLEYKITSGANAVGKMLFYAKERKELAFNGIKKDSLLLTATVSEVEKGVQIFRTGDSMMTQVDPETLQPHQMSVNFNGALSGLNQNVLFDQDRGFALTGGTNQVQMPVNTHNILSLFYAIRSFNLKPSKDATNPVNDTRVAVFYGNQFYVFLLRPAEAQIITLNDKKISAQQITIYTGNPTLDVLNLRLWLSNERDRIPLRFAIGNYQADLVSQQIVKNN